jgi:intracellular sulfur oxidation DsrE/DsrF family protein
MKPIRFRVVRAVFVVLIPSLFAACATPPPPPAPVSARPAEEKVRKVVYHADFSDPRRFSAMLTSITNMVNYYQSQLIDYDVRIVFVSHGIRFVTTDKLANTPFAEDKALREQRETLMLRLKGLNEVRGVKFELCDITREAVRLPKEKLMPGVTTVRSGVVRLAELQSQGFAYLKIE